MRVFRFVDIIPFFLSRRCIRNHPAEVIRHAEDFKCRDGVIDVHEFVTVRIFEKAAD